MKLACRGFSFSVSADARACTGGSGYTGVRQLLADRRVMRPGAKAVKSKPHPDSPPPGSRPPGQRDLCMQLEPRERDPIEATPSRNVTGAAWPPVASRRNSAAGPDSGDRWPMGTVRTCAARPCNYNHCTTRPFFFKKKCFFLDLVLSNFFPEANYSI